MSRLDFDLEADIQPVTEFRASTAEFLDRVRETGRPMVLTQKGRGAAVLVDIHSYQALIDEVELLRDVHRGLADIEAGRVVPHEDARARLLGRYR